MATNATCQSIHQPTMFFAGCSIPFSPMLGVPGTPTNIASPAVGGRTPPTAIPLANLSNGQTRSAMPKRHAAAGTLEDVSFVTDATHCPSLMALLPTRPSDPGSRPKGLDAGGGSGLDGARREHTPHHPQGVRRPWRASIVGDRGRVAAELAAELLRRGRSCAGVDEDVQALQAGAIALTSHAARAFRVTRSDALAPSLRHGCDGPCASVDPS